MPLAIHHRVTIADPRAHLVEVEATVRGDAPLGPLTFFMPVWSPGSYLVRDFARHVEGMACVEPEGAALVKVRKNAWRVSAPDARAITLRYRLYCNDLSVRTNHVDETHAFLNGAPTFLGVEGHERLPIRIEIAPPRGWSVATALPSRPSARGAPERFTFEAKDFDTLVDSPLEIGTAREARFEVLGKPHLLAVWPPGAASDRDVERFVGDARSILEAEAQLFGDGLPYESHTCILHMTPRARGGLEHASSVALIASPSSFGSRDAYLELLSLYAHETFHAWNVKRIRPEGLTPYRYDGESYTRLLWWFEGATSYYDWRLLRRAKLCTVVEYLEHLAGEIAYVEATPGRLVQSLEDASFDAWIKLYRPDENTANSSVSYYRKGELVCAMLDLAIRERSLGQRSLDDVTGHLWSEYGARDVPVPEGSMQAIVERVTSVNVEDLMDAWVRRPGEVEHAPLLRGVGLRVDRRARDEAPLGALGARLRGDGRVYIASVVRGGAAQRGGLDPGDEVLSVAGKRIDGTSLDAALAGKRAGEQVDVIVARDGRTLTRALTLDEPRADKVKLTADPAATPEQRARFTSWLGDPHPAWGAQ